MCRSGMKLPVSTLASLAILLAVTGCADFHSPRIDPSGEHLFIYDPSPAADHEYMVPACPPGTVPTLAPATVAPTPVPVVVPAPVPAAGIGPPPTPPPLVSPYSDVAAMLSPFRTVAPVGSQVVMVAGVRGGDGYLRTNRRLEWWLMPGSVGQFTSIEERNFVDFLVGDFTHPRLLSATSAVGKTTRVAERAGGPGSSVNVARGQGWITVSSAVEGASHVTVVAPDVVLPTERSKSATIYWIDAECGLPTPAIIPAGSKQSLTTTVWRQSNHCPRPGWIVRYETVCGPPAVFSPAGTPSIEALTNEAGQASVEIVEKDPSPGTSQVRVQVIRPADSCNGRLTVRETSVLVTWTAPSLGVRQMGPPTATIGETITYRMEVSNPGDLPARDVVATEEVPDGLSFLQANPVPVVEGHRLQWRLGDLAPRQQQLIEATFRTTQQGTVNHCVEVTAAGGLRSSHCATTNVLAAMPGPATVPGPAIVPGPATIPAPGSNLTSPEPRPTRATPPGPVAGPTKAAISVLDLKVTPPAQAVVGSNAQFAIELTNRGPVSATGVVVRDTFGEGLEHQERSPIENHLRDLPPGQSAKFAITFRVTRPGQLCHRVVATAADGAQAATDSCVMAVPATGSGGPVPAIAPPGPITVAPPPSASTAVPLEIRISGPTTATVGKSVVFQAQITNVGQQPLANVVVSQQCDAVLAVTQATVGATRKGNDVVWSLPSISPGKPVTFQVQCDCKQPATKACCHFSATPANGQPVDSQACLDITAVTSPAITTPSIPPAATPGRLSVFVDNINKVTAGKNLQFLVQVTNQGDSAENDIVVTARIPPGSAIDLFGTSGPSADIKIEKNAGQVRFSPVAQLPPRATIDYRVVVTTSSPGPISLQVEATSDRQKQPAVGRQTVDVLPAE